MPSTLRHGARVGSRRLDRRHPNPLGGPVPRLAAFALAVGLCLGAAPAAAGASAGVRLDAYTPTATQYTGIDPGSGLFYSYAPSVVETGPTTRDVFYCGNAPSSVVQDHIERSVGRLVAGRWQYSAPHIVFGPEFDPDSHGFFAHHTCEPEVVGGRFSFGGKPYRWALLFTAESVADNSTNQIGVAFANSLAGPFTADPTPLVQTSDDLGHNQYPNNCPLDSAGQTLYCLGEPAATTLGNGRILLTYMGNSGSPGDASAPGEGLVLRVLNLSDVPATGACTACFVSLGSGRTEEAVTTAGLDAWPHDASVAYDPASRKVVMTFDNGPADTTVDGPPVTPVVTVATIGVTGLLSGLGAWAVQGGIGQCLSGYIYNHNSGIVRTANGDVPAGGGASLAALAGLVLDSVDANAE